MPYDGGNLDEATRILIQARELLLDKGWCRGAPENKRGEHCALGAIYYGEGYCSPGARVAAGYRLHEAMPHEYGWRWIAEYNDAQTSIEPIIEWFDRAIAGGQDAPG